MKKMPFIIKRLPTDLFFLLWFALLFFSCFIFYQGIKLGGIILLCALAGVLLLYKKRCSEKNYRRLAACWDLWNTDKPALSTLAYTLFHRLHYTRMLVLYQGIEHEPFKSQASKIIKAMSQDKSAPENKEGSL